MTFMDMTAKRWKDCFCDAKHFNPSVTLHQWCFKCYSLVYWQPLLQLASVGTVPESHSMQSSPLFFFILLGLSRVVYVQI